MKELCHPEKKCSTKISVSQYFVGKKMRTSSYILVSVLKSVKMCDLNDELLEFGSTNLISF